MKIKVHAKPMSHHERVEKLSEGEFLVWVKEPPVKGLANLAIKNALADYFKISHSKIQLVSGFSSKNKIFEVIFDK